VESSLPSFNFDDSYYRSLPFIRNRWGWRTDTIMGFVSKFRSIWPGHIRENRGTGVTEIEVPGI
jgi:hypothetical protein